MAFIYFGTACSEVASVCSLVQRIIGKLEEHVSLPPSTLMDLRLMLSELLINGCEHGNRNDCHKLVSWELDIEDDRIDLFVRDEGEGFQWDPSSSSPSFSQTSGRGLQIVAGLADDFKVEKATAHCTLFRK